MKTKKTMIICSVVFILAALFALSHNRFTGAKERSEKVHGDQLLRKADHEENEKNEGLPGPAHSDEGHVRATEEEMKELGIELAKAGPGALRVLLDLPGEILLNDDRVASVTPYVSGYVKEIRKSCGDKVRAGEVMAVLESREVADAKAAFLAARARLALAERNYKREEGLWKKKISSEQDYLEARQALTEAEIEMRFTGQKLMALGLPKGALEKLPEEFDSSLTRYEIVSPLDGQVLEKNLSLGEMVKDDRVVYRVANMDSVWVRINVYQKDMRLLRAGAEAVISAGQGIPDSIGTISFLGPLVGEETRTAHARVLLPNQGGHWRPGLFVNVRVSTGEERIPLLIPKEAVQTIEGREVVFVPSSDVFEPRPISTGRSDRTHVEVVSGLSPGDSYVAKGAFEIKAAMATASLGAHAGHNH